jgi:hypothetical protein
MPVITFTDFSFGKDLRKGKSTSDANRLRELKNGFITTGKAIKKRSGTTLVERLETGTKGLVSAIGRLHTFYNSAGTITHANALFTPNKVEKASTLGSPSFTGSGLDDLTAAGDYTGASNCTFTVVIDAVVAGTSQTLISAALGTAIGNMTGSSGLTASFDGDSDELFANCSTIGSATTSYIGKDWGLGNTKLITGFKAWGTSDQGFVPGSNPNITITLQGSTDNFTTSVVNLGSAGDTVDADGLQISELTGLDTTTAFRYHRLKITKTGSAAQIGVAEVEFYEGTTTATYDTFKWKKDSGSYTTGVTLSGANQPLQDGITIRFGAITGHVVSEQWVFSVTKVTTAVSKVHYGDVFNGRLYTAVEYADLTIQHHYLDGSAGSRITDTNCPQTKGVVKVENKIWAVNGDTVRFSATGDPRDWTTASDAGFLPVGLKQRGANNSLALGQYKVNQLVVFFDDGAQLWSVDPDPANHSFTQILPGSSTQYHRGIAHLFQDLYFLSNFGFRSISESALISSQTELDIGSPIDSVIQALLPISPTDSPQAVFAPELGQYMAKIGDTIYVFTISQTAKISAWSEYIFPWSIDDIAVLDGTVYLRSGDDIYKMNDTVNFDGYETGKTITAMASGGTDITTITSAAHKRLSGDTVTIAGTTSYNGTFTITNITTNTFDIPTAFVANDATGTYTAGTPFEFHIQMSFVDAKKPGVLKTWQGADSVSTGSASLSFRYDPRETTFETDPITLTSDTRPDVMTPVEVSSVSISPIIKNSADEDFQIDALSLYYENLEVV